MLVDRKNWSLHARWFAIFLFGSLAAGAWYLAEGLSAQRWPGGSSRVGIALGIVAASIMVFEVLLWPRKRLRSWRIGRAQTWLQAHIWLGLLSVPLVVLHSGFHLRGSLSTVLVALFSIVIASGIWGLGMQQLLPRLLFNRVPAETIYAEIDHIARQNYEDAVELVRAVCGVSSSHQELDGGLDPGEDKTERHLTVGTMRAVGRTRGKVLQTREAVAAVPNSDALRTTFDDTIATYLEFGRRAGPTQLADPFRSAQLFEELKSRLDPAAHAAVHQIEGLCHQRRQFDLQIRMHHWLHGWLLVHAPLSVMLLFLLGLHIYFACKYW